MKTKLFLFISCLLALFLTSGISAATIYVNHANATPAAPYTTPATAATNLVNVASYVADGDTIYISDSYQQHLPIALTGLNNVTISAISGAAINASGYQYGISLLNGSATTIEGLVIMNASTAGVNAQNVASPTVQQCVFYNNYEGINFNTCWGPTVNQTLVYNSATQNAGIIMYNLSGGAISETSVYNAAVGVSLNAVGGGGGCSISFSTVSNCVIGISLTNYSTASVIYSNIIRQNLDYQIYVGGGANNNNVYNNELMTNYGKSFDASATRNPDYGIYNDSASPANTYFENYIIGCGAGGDDTTYWDEGEEGAVFINGATGCIVSSNYIVDCYNGIAFNWARDCMITGNWISNTVRYGIGAYSAYQNIIASNTIKNAATEDSWYYGGIGIQSAAYTNQVYENQIYDATRYGIVMALAGSSRPTGNTIRDNYITYSSSSISGRKGIYLITSQKNYIYTNYIENPVYGINVDSSTNCIVDGNVLISSVNDGIKVTERSRGIAVRNNTVESPSTSGAPIIIENSIYCSMVNDTVNNSLNGSWHDVCINNSDYIFATNINVYPYDVQADIAGFVIYGSRNCYVTNITVVGGQDGVKTAHQWGLLAYNNVLAGLNLADQSGGGIIIENTHDVAIRNSLIENPGWHSIYGSSITNIQFINITTVGGGASAINCGNSTNIALKSWDVESLTSGSSALDIWTCKKVTISNAYISAASGNGVKTWNDTEFVIKSSHISGNSGGHGIWIENSPGSLILSNFVEGIASDSYDGIRIDNGSTGAKISGNLVYQCAGYGITLYASSSGCTISNNAIHGNGNHGIYLSSGANSLVRNNTIISNQRSGGCDGINLDSSSTGVVIRNNILAFNGSGGSGTGIADATGAATVSYNCLYNPDGWNNYWNVSSPVNDIYVDPELASYDPSSSEYLFPTAYSPVLDAGDPADPVPAGGGSAIDIGAREYTGPRLVTDPAWTSASATYSSITINWTDADNETGYIFVVTNITDEVSVVTQRLAAGTTTRTVTGLAPETVYGIGLVATNSAFMSSIITTNITTPPGPPQPLSWAAITMIETNQFNAIWHKSSGVSAYLGWITNVSAGGLGNSSPNFVYYGSTNFFFPSAATNTLYKITIVATNDYGWTAPISTNIRTPLALPTQPQNVSTNAVATNSFTVTWSDCYAEYGYVYSISNMTTGAKTVSRLAANTASRAESGLTPQTSYTIEIYATNTRAASAVSSAVFTTAAPAPYSFSIIGITSLLIDSFTLTWHDSVYESSYAFIVTNVTSDVEVSNISLAANLTNKTVSGLMADTTYRIIIIAVNAAGESAAVVQTLTTPLIAAAPEATAWKATTDLTTSAFTLNWTNVLGESGYRLIVSNSSSAAETLNTLLSIDVTNYSLTGLADGTAYIAYLYATNSYGSSATISITVTTTLPGEEENTNTLSSVIIGPNPAAASVTAIRFANLPQEVSIAVYNVAGDLVFNNNGATVTTDDGSYEWIRVNNDNVAIAAGTYFVVIKDIATGKSRIIKLSLLQ